MKRTLYLLATLAAVATVFLALPPVPPAAAAPPGCFCAGYESTAPGTGLAATCEEAKTNLRAQGYAQIQCESGIGTCARELVLTSDCYWTPTAVAVDGYVRYRCWLCEP